MARRTIAVAALIAPSRFPYSHKKQMLPTGLASMRALTR